MDAEKAGFLRNRLVTLLRQIPTDTPPRWGKMTLQQMTEHFAEYVAIASGRKPFQDILTPPEQLDKVRAFVLNEKPFRENTGNPLLPSVPAPVKKASMEDRKSVV